MTATKSTISQPISLKKTPTEDDDDIDNRLRVRYVDSSDNDWDEAIPFLLRQAYHLPGYNWYQDWWQYMTNNHPVFGMCLHHKHHPLDWKMRTINLVGSMMFGLALTNFVYLAFVFVDQDSEQELLVAGLNATVTGYAELDSAMTSVKVTTGNLVLWFVGSPIQGFYDSIAWSLMGCGCCRFPNHDTWWAKLCRSSGAFVVTLSVIFILCVASFGSLLRAAIDADKVVEIFFLNTTTANFTSMMDGSNWTTTADTLGDATEIPDQFYMIENSHVLVQDEMMTLTYEQDFENYKFVVSYFVELLLSYVVYYPLIGTLFFSGLLSSCGGEGTWPLFAGRPYEIEQERLAALEKEAIESGVEVEWHGKDRGGMESSKAEEYPGANQRADAHRTSRTTAGTQLSNSTTKTASNAPRTVAGKK